MEDNDYWFELGKLSELERLSKSFREQSGRAYAIGDDEKAKIYRGIASDFRKEHMVRREKLETLKVQGKRPMS